MADHALDRLIFALDGDLSPLRVKYAEAEADAAKTGNVIARNLSPMNRLGGSLSGISGGLNNFSKGLRGIGEETDKLGGHSIRATYAVTILMRQLASGNLQGVPFTLARIGLGMAGMTTSTLLWGAAIAAVPIGFASAAIAAETSLARIRAAMAMTANQSGLTPQNIGEITARIGGAPGAASQYGARGIVSGLAGAGVPQEYMQRAGIAISQAERGGMKEEDAIALISEIFNKPSAAAQEMADKFHMINEAQAQDIEKLDAHGKSTEASRRMLDLFAQRAGEAADSASWFSNMLNGAGKAAGSFIVNFGKLFGIGETPEEKKAWLEFQVRKHEGMPDLQAPFQKQLDALNAQAKRDADKAKADEAAAKAGRLLAPGRDIADAYDTQRAKAENLTGQLKKVTDALGVATTAEDKRNLAITKASLQSALDHQIDPAKEAQLRATEDVRIARTAPEQRARVSAQIEAGRQLRANLANPAMVPYAQSIYAAQMGASRAPTSAESALAERQRLNLVGMQTEADMQEKIATAYGVSTAAAEKAKIEGEAHLAVLKKQVSNEEAYTQALARRGTAQAYVAEASRLADQRAQIAGQGRVMAAGGNPALIAQADAVNKAIEETRAARDTAQAQLDLAKTDAERTAALEAVAQAQAQYNQTLADYLNIARQSLTINAQAGLYGARQDLANARQTLGAVRGGANSDDLRHLKVMQDTIRQLGGPDTIKASKELQDIYADLLPVNEQLSDMNDALQKTQEAAKGFADAITGPLQSALSSGDTSHLLSDITSQILSVAVKTYITDPLNKELTSIFGDMLGADQNHRHDERHGGQCDGDRRRRRDGRPDGKSIRLGRRIGGRRRPLRRSVRRIERRRTFQRDRRCLLQHLQPVRRRRPDRARPDRHQIGRARTHRGQHARGDRHSVARAHRQCAGKRWPQCRWHDAARGRPERWQSRQFGDDPQLEFLWADGRPERAQFALANRSIRGARLRAGTAQHMSAFDEVQFPVAISFNSTGGPMRQTQIVVLGSGAERRNARWANSRRAYNIGYLRSMDDAHAIIEFFEARNGRLIGFRFKDWSDFKSCAPQQAVTPTDQVLQSSGSGTLTTLQLLKLYNSGASSWTRNIVKPVTGSVRLAYDGIETEDFTVDTTTGLVTCTPGAGVTVTAGYEFDVPARFDTDKLEINLKDALAGELQNIPILELPSP